MRATDAPPPARDGASRETRQRRTPGRGAPARGMPARGARLAPLDRERQARIGLALALAIGLAWLANHAALVWFVDPRARPLETGLRALVQVWLSVGLFIVAHDCMHGSLAPGRPGLNAAVGRVVLFLYAGFPWRPLLLKHHAHHRHAGTADDPDFDHENPDRPVRWYLAFMSEYLSWRLFGWVTLLATLYSAALVVLHPDGAWRWLHVFAFWLFPSLLASIQLFWFGTFLPHRHEAAGGFADRHNSRSNAYPTWLSLITCFHFGYHHEHHLAPSVPWWRLPALRRLRAAGPGSAPA